MCRWIREPRQSRGLYCGLQVLSEKVLGFGSCRDVRSERGWAMDSFSKRHKIAHDNSSFVCNILILPNLQV